MVCEGAKTEPNYFGDLRSYYRIHNANIYVRNSNYGTTPLQIVEYARDFFSNGDQHRHVQKLAFDHVYAVFDRDDHDTYHAALNLAESLNGRMRNDQKKPVPFEAIASVPNFELWLLLHFRDVRAPMHRDEVVEALREEIEDYQKGGAGYFQQLLPNLKTAMGRATYLCETYNRQDGVNPYTDIGTLVDRLCKLKP